jgi:hypothetical protein
MRQWLLRVVGKSADARELRDHIFVLGFEARYGAVGIRRTITTGLAAW